jgi:DNA repair exonuclease SbcCD nuclease subunit
MRVLILGDIHLSDRPPSIRTESYASDILAKLEHTLALVDEHAIEAVIWAGDVFHLKAPTRTSHALVQRTAEIGQSYNCPWLIVPGNHDLQHDRLDTLDRQPLGVLFKAGAQLCVGQTPVGANELVFGIPWLYDWKKDLPVYMKAWQESHASLMVAHAPIVRPGTSRPYEVIDAEDWRTLMVRPGAVYWGHIHDPDGAFFTSHYDTMFCNEGALSRGSLHEATLARKPAVTLYDSGTGTFERIEVPHRPVEEVFRLADKAVEDARADRLDVFLASIGSTTLSAVSVEGVLADLRDRGVRPEVLREAEECFDQTG